MICSSNAFILLYNITSRTSFESLPSIRKKILEIRNPADINLVPIVIVGGMANLGPSDAESKRQVPASEGKELADSWNCPFFETTPVTGQNVREAFFQTYQRFKVCQDLHPNSNDGDTQKRKQDKHCIII